MLFPLATAERATTRKRAGSKRVLPLLPLRGIVVFPNMSIPLEVGRDKSVAALDEAIAGDRLVFLSAQRSARINDPAPEDIYEVGTVSEIKQLVKLPDGTIRVVVEGRFRARLLDYVSVEPCFLAKVQHIPSVIDSCPELEATARAVYEEFDTYVKLSKRLPAEVMATIGTSDEPGRMADDIAANMPLKAGQKQDILETASVMMRLEKLAAMIHAELDILDLERRIQARVRKQMEKAQKEYYLREQMKAIQRELGEGEERASEIQEIREKIASMNLPAEVREKARKELSKLESMPPATAEVVVVRNYLDWLLGLPWGIYTQDRLDINRAEQVLNEDHWGIEKVKERILEFLAVRQLSDSLRGPILCLVGPPGVGKTSLGRSIARALDRKFVRFSLGGVRDEAEIRGHRRTYVGAMPGKLVQLLKQAGSMNPVILLDEIDKMSSDFRGDPAAALLEMLDPEQNRQFGDHYLEVGLDLSQVMFVTTANTLYSIPRALQDRMEIIQIPGYTEDDKLHIASQFLVPKQVAENGLRPDQVIIPDETVTEIIRSYTRESGVRSLERQIGSVCRKLAREVVGGKSGPFEVTKVNLGDYLGVPLFHYGLAESEDKVGVAMGLAWTEMGGETMAIEVSVMRGNGKLILTGKLGDVMRESAQAGYTYLRTVSDSLGVPNDFNERGDVHIHIPEGAIPKDGPSAGITMATALASALTGIPVRHDVAMTGEITLRGRVLPIGGLKEKLLAAKRAGITTVVIPADNARDLDEITENVKEGLTLVRASSMSEVLTVALSAMPRPVSDRPVDHGQNIDSDVDGDAGELPPGAHADVDGSADPDAAVAAGKSETAVTADRDGADTGHEQDHGAGPGSDGTADDSEGDAMPVPPPTAPGSGQHQPTVM